MVRTKTGTYGDSETDDDIILSLRGTACESRGYNLDDPNRNDFERGHLDNFTIHSPYLGAVSHFVFMVHGIKQVRTNQCKAAVLRCDSTVVFSRLSKVIFNKQKSSEMFFSVCIISYG